MKNFLDEYGLLIGVLLMILFSATAAYIREFEKAAVEWARKKHFFVFFSKLVYAAFSGLIVWYASNAILSWGIKFPEPIIPMAVGIAGYAGAQFVDWIFSFATRFAEKRAGIDRKDTP